MAQHEDHTGCNGNCSIALNPDESAIVQAFRLSCHAFDAIKVFVVVPLARRAPVSRRA